MTAGTLQPSGKEEPSAVYDLACDHCGEPCPSRDITIGDKQFCCEGCRTVYDILQSNGLCKYYEIDENAGISLRGKRREAYAYLDDPEVRDKLINFSDGVRTRITFFLPQIHCASCIWLLENLYKLNDGVLESRVNFLKKELHLTFDESISSLRQITELLASIGYAPAINFSDLTSDKKPVADRSFYYKMGVAGFAFGNIMLLSFPEYLGLDRVVDTTFSRLFGYLNILLALPVVFYSAQDYLRSAWLGLKQRELNIDVPIALGVATLFFRSVFEILTQTGAGYLDSLGGLIFFLLIGKWFQQRTYHNISFERDYRSYFPIAATRKEGLRRVPVSLDKLVPGDAIFVRHQEIIPADSILMKGQARIDYSFVTGESDPVLIPEGEKVFAGGRQLGQTIELHVIKKVSQSYLTQLWNEEAFKKQKDTRASELANRVGKYFTIIILLIAFTTLFYWMGRDLPTAINAFTAVLIIACPCAVALAIPFIFGNVLRILGRQRFYLKNTQVIEALESIDTFIFDKTGTLTVRNQGQVSFQGQPLQAEEKAIVRALTQHSTHPLSQLLFQSLPPSPGDHQIELTDWEEVTGLGIKARFNGSPVLLGSAAFTGAAGEDAAKGVYLKLGESPRGYFRIDQSVRFGAENVLAYFRQQGTTFLLSGDNEREKKLFQPLFPKPEQMRFRQEPKDKLEFIRECQQKAHKVLMLGDGLNDAGALRQSDVGIVVTENTNNFTPASDAIIHADSFFRLPVFLTFARKSIRLVYGAYAFALIYNTIGLSFAVRGALSPVVAAILMPLSSISIVLFGMVTSNLLAGRLGLGGDAKFPDEKMTKITPASD